jgi:hypothetical protein
VTSDVQLIRKTVSLPAAAQRQAILDAGLTPIASYNQTDFVKDRIAVEVQFGKYSFVAYDLFVKHMAFYVGDVKDVGVEILPMKVVSAQMSSGISYYEGELYYGIRLITSLLPRRGCRRFPLAQCAGRGGQGVRASAAQGSVHPDSV